MTIKEAVRERHMVRKYTDKPIPIDIVKLLEEIRMGFRVSQNCF